MKNEKPRKARKNEGLGVADSMSQAASMLGCGVEDLRRAKRSGCAGFRSNRVYLDEVSGWLASNPVKLDPDSKEALERKKLRLQCERLQHALDVDRRLFKSTAACEAEGMKLGEFFRVGILRFVGEAPNWAGLKAPALALKAEDLADEVMEELEKSIRDFCR